MTLDFCGIRAHYCRAVAIVAAGFDDSNHEGGHTPTFAGAAFFVSAFGLQLVCRVLGGIAPAGFLCDRFVNPILGAPFLFDDEKGVYISQGGSL